MANTLHLAKRFFGSLNDKPPESRDEAWVKRHLNAGETELWKRMSNPDKRHAAQVGLDVASTVGAEVPKQVVAAAVLHDVGKVESGLGTGSRVVATLFWSVVDSLKAEKMSERDGFMGRLAKYHLHPQIGAQLLTEVGSHPWVIAWAQEHHLEVEDSVVPAEYVAVLRACDND